MKHLFGNTHGLKANQLKRLEKLYRRRIPPEFLITPELARDLTHFSSDINRQIGLLIERRGRIVSVIIGDAQGIVIPDLDEYRSAPDRLKGVRCVHTHLKDEPLSFDDLTDLSLLRLDFMAVVTIDRSGGPHQVHAAHILPGTNPENVYQILDPIAPNRLDIDCLVHIKALEDELAQTRGALAADGSKERALLISVTTGPRATAEDSLAELKDLAASCDVLVVGSELQLRRKLDPRFLMGLGRFKEILISAMQRGASLIVFDQELNASQIRSITDLVALKVVDRTQLILDIFAQRAQTRAGKLQVELAQLKYLLPRLVTKNTAMSRLTGGIGGRGPGETKLEIHRRRARERIKRIQKDLRQVVKRRRQQKARRDKRGVPVISIIGYTNAGKSTLLNTLTQSRVLTANKLFATLDPSSRRLRFPRDIEVIITDTVGFIRDLPKDLMVAFQATLEELEKADLLLHVIDVSSPRFEDQIESVEKILADLKLHRIPMVRVMNKQDKVAPEFAEKTAARFDATLISATKRTSLMPLIERMESMIAP
jgi:GTPase